MRTPDYKLIKEFKHIISANDAPIIFPAGTFVRPIDFRYLPRDMQKDVDNQFLNRIGNVVFCYTSAGIIPIPKEYMRQA
jgi:hypothetical protein